MAAGLGFKDFTTGEVLTAADVDGYLMQGIWVFANATARDAAVTSPQEGNFAFLKDTNTTTYYTGSAWANLDTTGMVNPMTTTGDTIYSSSGSTPARLGIGTAGQVLQVNSGATAPEWATPASGTTTFTNRLVATQTGWQRIAYNGSNLWVAVGQAGQLYSSSNGTTWTQRTSGFGSSTIRSIAFGNSLWVIVGENGLLSTSTDGITWTSRTANMSTNTINDVAYANSIWVAVGAGGGGDNTGGITYSTDGITWTRKSQSVTVGSLYQCVAWNGTNWIVGSSNSTNNYLYASTPSGSWTAAQAGGSFTINWLVWTGTAMIFRTSYPTVRRTTSTTLASSFSFFDFTITGNKFPVIYYNSELYCVEEYVYKFTDPAQEVINTQQILGFNPTATLSSSTGYGFETQPATIWAGSQGIIIGDEYGRIYTSF